MSSRQRNSVRPIDPQAARDELPLIVIAGPTGIGKTETALKLAEQLDGELVGADSVQVYRGFDIGSAKPRPDELRGIDHHLIDILDPPEEIDAMRFAELADRAIAGIRARGKRPIVVGGTGLWLRALLRGLVAVPPVDSDLRASLEARIEREGSEALHRELSKIDPLTAAAVHPNDAMRIVRALEVYEQTGEALGELRRRHALGAPRYRAFVSFIDRAIEASNERILQRVETMLQAGWVDEVQRLIDRWGYDIRPLGSVGYQEIVALLRGELAEGELPTRIAKATRVYARRQRTWFRSEPGVDFRDTPEALLERLSAEGHDQR